MQIHKILLPVLALGLLFGCGGGSSKSSSTPAPATVNVYLGADSIPGFNSITVTVAKVEWSPDGGSWYSMGTPNGSYDLVKLQNGNGYSATGLLVSKVAMTEATIKWFRLSWATTNGSNASAAPAFVLVDNPDNPDNPVQSGVLTMPGSTTAGALGTTIFPADIVVAAGSTVEAEIMIAGAGAVQNTGKATSTANPQTIYTFMNATGQGFDRGACCSITGTLQASVTATLAPLSNVEVYAETVVGQPSITSIVRRAITDSNGNYTLDALPATNSASTAPTYYVVSQAFNYLPETNAYLPQASAPVVASTSPAVFPSVDLTFTTLAPTVGTIAATINPASTMPVTNVTQKTQSTWAELSQLLLTPSNQSVVGANLIIRSTEAVTGASSDLITLASLPTGQPYIFTAQRTTTTGTSVPLAPVALSLPTSLTLTSGVTTPVTLTYIKP